MGCATDAAVYELLSWNRGDLNGILPSQEARMIGKRKASLVYYLYLQIGRWMFMLREMIRLFGLLNPRGPSLLRVYVIGCLGLWALFCDEVNLEVQSSNESLFPCLGGFQGQGPNGDHA